MTPTASLTTAARHLYEALACTDDRDMEAIEAAFAQVRRDALEEAEAELQKLLREPLEHGRVRAVETAILRIRALSDAPTSTAKVCAANRSADPPQDCDWPFCGCDPAATKVLEALNEMDLLRPSPGWRDISTAPKDGTYILGWCEQWLDQVIALRYLTGLRRWNTSFQPTHWQPLPDPPSSPVKAGGEGAGAPTTQTTKDPER